MNNKGETQGWTGEKTIKGITWIVKINYKSDVLLTDTVKILFELHIVIDI